MAIQIRLISVAPNSATIVNVDEIRERTNAAFPSVFTISTEEGFPGSATMAEELDLLEQRVRAELAKCFPEGTQFEIIWVGTERQGVPLAILTNVTPRNLAEIVWQNRTWVKYSKGSSGPADLGAIGDQEIETVLAHCYYASLQPEEGRYPRFCVFVAGEKRQPALTARFTVPVELTANTLRKLAPAVAVRHAILVVERHGTLFCDGIVEVSDWETGFLLEETQQYGLHSGLEIRVEGPGEMIVSEAFLTYHSRGPDAWPEFGFGAEWRVYEWLNEATGFLASACLAHAHSEGIAAGELLRRLEQRCGLYEASRSGHAADDLLTTLWTRVLVTARELRHGGAFVVHPDDHLSGIILTHQTQGLDLGSELVSLWKAKIEDNPLEVSRRKNRLLRTATAISCLSAVDGCVVLDRALKVRGFGGMIQIDDQHLQHQTRSFAQRTGIPRAENDLPAFGARHRSAIRLCKAFANMLVFVVSQDGDLRVFSSDSEHWYETRISGDSGLR